MAIGGSRTDSQLDDLNVVKATMMSSKPCGLTPIVPHLIEIFSELKKKAHQLRNKGQKAAIIIATDGLPTTSDGMMGTLAKDEFINALRAFQGMPVWIVIRLCTNDEHVVKFYNEIDCNVELSIEVIDDFYGEAGEVEAVNSWLCYSLPLHRCREFGFHDSLLDLVDERSLTKTELRAFCALIFDVSLHDLPDPEVDYEKFKFVLEDLLQKELMQYNPRKHKMTRLIDLDELDRSYAPHLYFSRLFLRFILKAICFTLLLYLLIVFV